MTSYSDDVNDRKSSQKYSYSSNQYNINQNNNNHPEHYNNYYNKHSHNPQEEKKTTPKFKNEGHSKTLDYNDVQSFNQNQSKNRFSVISPRDDSGIVEY